MQRTLYKHVLTNLNVLKYNILKINKGMKKLAIALLILLPFTLTAQTKICGSDLHSEAISLYYNEQYNDALKKVEQYLPCMNYSYIYDAACIAAKAGKNDLAFLYLNKAIMLGWTDKDHLMSDNDLKALKDEPEWKGALRLMDNRIVYFDSIVENSIELNKISLLVPYKKGGLWGYLDSKTEEVAVEPIFSQIDFLNGTKKLFIGDRYYEVNSDTGINKKYSAPIFSEQVFEDSYHPTDSLSQGFTAEKMGFRTSKYTYAANYNSFKGYSIKNGYFGIRDKTDIINQSGELINGLSGFDYLGFHNYGEDSKDDLAPFQDRNNDFLIFYGKGNEFGYIDHTFKMVSLNNDDNMERKWPFYDFSSKNFEVCYRYVYLSESNEVGVFDALKKEWIIKPKYNAITRTELINGVLFFLVEDNGKQFYITDNGKKYLKK